MRMVKQIPVKKLLLLFTFILFQISMLAQTPASGIIVGGNIGISKVLTEIYPDFTTVNEFDHQPGLILEPELNKLFGKHYEIGTSFTIASLKGKTDDPQFSAEGFHSAMMDPITEPVHYKTTLMGQKFYFGFYFNSFEKIDKPFKIEPFVRLGGGYFYYTSEFGYQDPELGVIFGKGVEGYTDLTTGVLFLSGGIKMYITPNLFINTTLAFNYVRYDFLDAVHNYNAEGYRDNRNPDVRGIYADFKIGLFYQFTAKGVKSGKTGTPGAYLPFSK